MSPKEIVLKYFPDANDDTVDFILWEKTGYPSFFRKESDLEKQIKKYKKACDIGKDVCICCGKITKLRSLYTCKKCDNEATIRRKTHA